VSSGGILTPYFPDHVVVAASTERVLPNFCAERQFRCEHKQVLCVCIYWVEMRTFETSKHSLYVSNVRG
jgi:hypothetical protein